MQSSIGLEVEQQSKVGVLHPAHSVAIVEGLWLSPPKRQRSPRNRSSRRTARQVITTILLERLEAGLVLHGTEVKVHRRRDVRLPSRKAFTSVPLQDKTCFQRSKRCSYNLAAGSARRSVPWVLLSFGGLSHSLPLCDRMLPDARQPTLDCCSTSKPMLDCIQSCVEARERKCAAGDLRSKCGYWSGSSRLSKAGTSMTRREKQRLFRIRHCPAVLPKSLQFGPAKRGLPPQAESDSL